MFVLKKQGSCVTCVLPYISHATYLVDGKIFVLFLAYLTPKHYIFLVILSLEKYHQHHCLFAAIMVDIKLKRTVIVV